MVELLLQIKNLLPLKLGLLFHLLLLNLRFRKLAAVFLQFSFEAVILLQQHIDQLRLLRGCSTRNRHGVIGHLLIARLDRQLRRGAFIRGEGHSSTEWLAALVYQDGVPWLLLICVQVLIFRTKHMVAQLNNFLLFCVLIIRRLLVHFFFLLQGRLVFL